MPNQKRGPKGRFVKSTSKGKSRWRKGGGWVRRRFHRPRKIPALPVAGAALGLMARGSDGTWASPIEAIQNGSPAYIAQSFINTYTGLKIPFPGTGYSSGGVQFDIMRTINPFDLGYAPGLKYSFWGGIASMALKAFGVTRRIQPYMNKIPIVKKFTL